MSPCRPPEFPKAMVVSTDACAGPLPRCQVCVTPARMTCHCGARYCSKSCQSVDWKERGHKTICKRLAKARAAKAARDGTPSAKAAPLVVVAPPAAAARPASPPAAAAEAPPVDAGARCPVCLEDWVLCRRCYLCDPTRHAPRS